MDRNIEEKFVKTFLVKRVQERICFELNHVEKRRKIISRFANPEELIKKECIHIASKNLSIQEIEKEIAKYYNLKQRCYTISSNEKDGELFDFKVALHSCMEDYMPSVIILGDSFAFIKTETEVGSPMKFILYSPNY